MNTVEEFVKDCGKPRTVKDYISNGAEKAKEMIRNGAVKVRDGVKWIAEHPQEAAIYATLFTGTAAVVKKGCRTIDKHVTARRETYNKERYVYDHSAGRYLKTRRVLRSDDVRRINDLRARHPGMKMSEALDRLGLLD